MNSIVALENCRLLIATSYHQGILIAKTIGFPRLRVGSNFELGLFAAEMAESIIHLYDAPHYPPGLPAMHRIETKGSKKAEKKEKGQVTTMTTTLVSSSLLNLYNNEVTGALGWFVDG